MTVFNLGEIVINSVLKAIRDRRSSSRFKSTPVDEEKLNVILEAGRWAPSWANTQPWRFIIIKDEGIKERMSEAVSTFFKSSIKDAPICVAVCVNPKKDSFHFIEDGATATQNMALAAQSIGLSTSWIGVFSLRNEKNSSEKKLKEILGVPKEWRLISILPLGVPELKETSARKELSTILDFNRFVIKEEHKSELESREELLDETEKVREPESSRELERALV
jgi:nitroreductase